MRTRIIRYLSIGFCLAIIWTATVSADAITAASCSRQDVLAAINTVNDGDIVFVPPGSCTWTDELTIPDKEVFLFGAGIDQTTIHLDLTSGVGKSMFYIYTFSGKKFRISGFTFTTGTPTPEKGIIHFDGDAEGFRIDHNKFLDINCKALVRGGDSTGVVDHNEFLGMFRGMDFIGSGDAAWEDPWTPGTADAVFIEDNVFDQAFKYTTVSCHRGCRYTFRYNTVVNGGISTHGADTTTRAGGVIEAYNNTFTSVDFFVGVFMRGGTAIIFNNEFTGYGAAIGLANYRTCQGVSVNLSPPNDSRCDGSALVDGNAALEAGSHDGNGNAPTLSHSSGQWGAGDLVGFHVYNLTDGSKCKISANTATTATCALTGGTENEWDSGDQYKITSGWPCKDQVGRGPGPLTQQTSEPIYQWNNSWSHNGPYVSPEIGIGGYECENPSPTQNIKSGRDYFDNTPRPGYTPYVYPHPLTVEQAPQWPKNLRLRQ